MEKDCCEWEKKGEWSSWEVAKVRHWTECSLWSENMTALCTHWRNEKWWWWWWCTAKGVDLLSILEIDAPWLYTYKPVQSEPVRPCKEGNCVKCTFKKCIKYMKCVPWVTSCMYIWTEPCILLIYCTQLHSVRSLLLFSEMHICLLVSMNIRTAEFCVPWIAILSIEGHTNFLQNIFLCYWNDLLPFYSYYSFCTVFWSAAFI